MVLQEWDEENTADAALVHHGPHDRAACAIKVAFAHVGPGEQTALHNAFGSIGQVRIHLHLSGLEHLDGTRQDVDMCGEPLRGIFRAGQDQCRHICIAQHLGVLENGRKHRRLIFARFCNNAQNLRHRGQLCRKTSNTA